MDVALKTAFYIVWCSSVGANCLFLLADNIDAAYPFAIFNIFCTGLALGWFFAGKRMEG